MANLARTLVGSKDKREASDFLNDLLSQTEMIMLGKRLTVIWLLYKEVPYDEIRDKLKISTSTIYRISGNLEEGHYDNILSRFKSEKKLSGKISLFEELYDLLHLGGALKPYGRIDKSKYKGKID